MLKKQILPTLEGIFSSFREMGLTFDQEELSRCCFEYACKIVEVEGINTENKRNKGFLEYIMRLKAQEIFFAVRKRFDKYGTLEGIAYIPPKPEEIDHAIQRYITNPLNKNTYRNFLGAKHRGEV
jgi:hypothetical protein